MGPYYPCLYGPGQLFVHDSTRDTRWEEHTGPGRSARGRVLPLLVPAPPPGTIYAKRDGRTVRVLGSGVRQLDKDVVEIPHFNLIHDVRRHGSLTLLTKMFYSDFRSTSDRVTELQKNKGHVVILSYSVNLVDGEPRFGGKQRHYSQRERLSHYPYVSLLSCFRTGRSLGPSRKTGVDLHVPPGRESLLPLGKGA